MKEITKLFETYYARHNEDARHNNQQVSRAEKALNLYLYEQLEEEHQSELVSLIYELTKAYEQQSFTHGYTTATRLLFESLCLEP